MRIKKIIANNYSEALSRVRSEMGNDALILETRTIKGPENRAGNSDRVEITAAVERQEVSGNDAPSARNRFFELTDDDEVCREKEFKAFVMTLLTQTDKARAMGLKENHVEGFKMLLDKGIDERLAIKFLENFERYINRQGGELQFKGRTFRDFMKSFMVCGGGIGTAGNSPKAVAFVGPTGVGKTTTIAKLAALFAFRESKKVAIFSLDTYRMGAVEQLRLYGEIMEIPIEICASQEEVHQAMNFHSDKDLILIDTMGKSHSDHAYSAQLKHMLKGTSNLETHLVLSVTSQEEIMEESFKQFASMGLDRVLFTKLDEGFGFGSMLNFSVRNRLPISYLTTGQRVPEDIEVARQERAIGLIFDGYETRV